MTSISDVILMCWDFARTTEWHFNLFGRSWDMTFLQIWFIPVMAFFTIRIIKHIYEIVSL